MNTTEINPLQAAAEKKAGFKSVCVIGAASLIYAVVRYVLFSPKYAENIPSFISNKAIGMAAAFYLVAAYHSKCRGFHLKATVIFKAAMIAVVIHVPTSLSLVRPGYFPDFFVDDGSTMKFWAEMVVLCGGISLALLWITSQQRLWGSPQAKLGIQLLCSVFLHVGSMGICRGLNITAKHAYLPPMWLLSLLGIALGIVILSSFIKKS
jgi:hypothetical protein